jgi:hypothetical protein
MNRYSGPNSVIITLHGGLCLAITMDRYAGPRSAITIALHGSDFLPIIIDRYCGPHTLLTIALHGELNLANIMES